MGVVFHKNTTILDLFSTVCGWLGGKYHKNKYIKLVQNLNKTDPFPYVLQMGVTADLDSRSSLSSV